MILEWKDNGKGVNVPSEIKCDICSVVFDDQGELDEFICFDFTTGKGSTLSNGMRVVFDVCQDCFQDAFHDFFLGQTEVPFDELDKIEQENEHEGDITE